MLAAERGSEKKVYKKGFGGGGRGTRGDSRIRSGLVAGGGGGGEDARAPRDYDGATGSARPAPHFHLPAPLAVRHLELDLAELLLRRLRRGPSAARLRAPPAPGCRREQP